MTIVAPELEKQLHAEPRRPDHDRQYARGDRAALRAR
jgi:hypothetical protein